MLNRLRNYVSEDLKKEIDAFLLDRKPEVRAELFKKINESLDRNSIPPFMRQQLDRASGVLPGRNANPNNPTKSRTKVNELQKTRLVRAVKELPAIYPELVKEYELAKKTLENPSKCTGCSIGKALRELRIGVVKLGVKKDTKELLESIFGGRFSTTQDVQKNTPAKVAERKQLLENNTRVAPRDSCLDCVGKHLGQAAVLFSESKLGYPTHRWLAIGHMAEASEESIKDHPDLAHKIRIERLLCMDDKTYIPDVMVLLTELQDLIDTSDVK